MNDLREYTTQPTAVRRADGSYLVRREGSIITLSRIGTVFRLEVRLVKDDESNFPLIDEVPVATSVDDYQSWFKGQDCDPKIFTVRMLKGLSDDFSQLNESNIGSACAWTVQLIADLGRRYNKPITIFSSYGELRDELQDLIEDAIIDL